MKLLCCALALAALALPAARASSPATVPALVYTPGYGNSIVGRIDPVSLARSGPRVRLGGNASSWSYSPEGRYLAIATYPQRLTVLEAASLRVVARVRLARGGGVVRAVTWTDRDRVVSVLEAKGGTVVIAVQPFDGRVIRRTELSRPYGFETGRLRDGLVFLLGARGRLAPVQLAVVDAEGRTRVAAVPQVLVGSVMRDERGVEYRDPGLAVDAAGRKAYVVGGDRLVGVDLKTLRVSDPGPLRTLAKVVSGSTRSATWLGRGRLAVSGADWDAEGGYTPAGLRIVDVRSWSARVVAGDAGSFVFAGDRLLVERARPTGTLNVTAYGLDARERYSVDLPLSNWAMKEGRLGYACRGAFVRSVFDLATGAVLRSGFAASTRCPTVLRGDSRA